MMTYSVTDQGPLAIHNNSGMACTMMSV